MICHNRGVFGAIRLLRSQLWINHKMITLRNKLLDLQADEINNYSTYKHNSTKVHGAKYQ